MNRTPPAITVHVNERIDNLHLTELLLGIEEEGVPVEVQRRAELNPLVLAHAAALSSHLGVGIGIALGYVVITLEKLPESRPYIADRFNVRSSRDRIAGSNAARLVKRLPLRAAPRPSYHSERTP